MTPQQTKTAKRLGVFAAGLLGLLGYLGWVEFDGVLIGAPITDLVRMAWEAQPGAILLVVVVAVLVLGYHGGHFFWSEKRK